ncbi:MAG: response regulator [Bdellovibrionaceae bacterium]|nr:response regulator [Bdellovibrionales bacterium]MCB9082745.1 response regulator [Pseudobdellovibrionaceae bacterium]
MAARVKTDKHIMVVEDDAAMQELIKEFLEGRGFRLSVFRSALKALEALNAAAKGGIPPVDLVISDINMPQMDGFEFLQLAQQTMPEVPVILITAFGNRVTEKAALQEGAVAYLNKPFSLAELHQVVSSHVTATA